MFILILSLKSWIQYLDTCSFNKYFDIGDNGAWSAFKVVAANLAARS